MIEQLLWRRLRRLLVLWNTYLFLQRLRCHRLLGPSFWVLYRDSALGIVRIFGMNLHVRTTVVNCFRQAVTIPQVQMLALQQLQANLLYQHQTWTSMQLRNSHPQYLLLQRCPINRLLLIPYRYQSIRCQSMNMGRIMT